MEGYKHYLRIENGIVIKGFTDGFLIESGGNEEILPGDMLLNGYEQRQFQLNLTTPEPRNQFKYKIVNGQMVERTQAELDEEWAARPPEPKTPEQKEVEKLKADNTNLNNQIIDLWETLLTSGVL